MTATLATLTREVRQLREQRSGPTTRGSAERLLGSLPVPVRAAIERGQQPAPAAVDEHDDEIFRCLRDPAHFIATCCRIKDEGSGDYKPFVPWDSQAEVLDGLRAHRFAVLLKARQVGMTTLVIAWAVWMAVFRPGSTILLFSKGQAEAKDLVRRIRGTIVRLPLWLRPVKRTIDSTQILELSNGSRFISFASRSSGGDSYTASLVIIDEADLVPDLDELMEGAKPTIGDSGQLVLLSRVDKSKPESAFKKVWRGAEARSNDYWTAFIPWHARPGRTAEWYAAQAREIETRTGSLDDLYAQYPATPEEALAPRSLDKRLPFKWLKQAWEDLPAIAELPPGAPTIPGLRVYQLPIPGRKYVVGGDPAEGNPNSDDSAAVVLDATTYEEVASLIGKYEPGVLAFLCDQIGQWYNRAALMIERNNHGHAVILWLDEHSRLDIVKGHDGKAGWHQTAKGKSIMYDATADVLREGKTRIHTRLIHDQLASIEGSTLRAPEGQHDDGATAYALAVIGVPLSEGRELRLAVLGPPTPAEPTSTAKAGDVLIVVENGNHFVRLLRDAGDPLTVGRYGTAVEASYAQAVALRDKDALGRFEGALSAEQRAHIRAMTEQQLQRAGVLNARR